MINPTGFKDVLWFVGRVEAVGTGPENAGNVRVRAYGIHPPETPEPKTEGSFGYNDIEGVETEQLPWAPVLNSTGGGANLMPPKGELVVGMFLDGRDAQYPIIIGTVPGMNLSLPSGSGYPQYDDPYIKPSDSSVENFGTFTGGVDPRNAASPSTTELESIAGSSPDSVTTADGEEFSEFIAVSGGDPDKNLVLRARAEGSNIQVGGDGMMEHIAMVHREGNHIQIDSHGNIKQGSKENVQTWAKNIQSRANGRFDVSAGEGFTVRVDAGGITIQGTGNVSISSNNDIDFNAGGEIKLNSTEGVFIRGSKVTLQATADNIDIASPADVKISADGDASISAGANMNIQGGFVGVKGDIVALDDEVRMAEGLAIDAKPAVVPTTDKMAPPGGRAAISPTPVVHSGTPGDSYRGAVDDAEPGAADPNAQFNGDGLEKGIGIYCQLQADGYSRAAAAGIVGNMMVESANFTADWAYNGEDSRGWLQWHADRRQSFDNYAAANGLSPTSDAANYGYLVNELNGSAGNHWSSGGSTSAYRGMGDVTEATDYFMRKYVRPAESTNHYSQRLAYAKQVYASECPVNGSGGGELV